MKKVISCVVAIALMLCAVASVSAAISPEATADAKYIIVDAVAVGGDSHGKTVPTIDAPYTVDTSEGETVTLTATPSDGFQFSHWEFKTGEFEIIEGDLSSSVIVIKPIGDNNVRAYAYFVEEGEDVTPPASSDDVQQPDDDNKAPTTGDSVATYAVASTITMLAVAAIVILKKRANA